MSVPSIGTRNRGDWRLLVKQCIAQIVKHRAPFVTESPQWVYSVSKSQCLSVCCQYHFYQLQSLCVVYLCVPFPCDFFRGLSSALRSHDQIPASHWPSCHMIRSRPRISRHVLVRGVGVGWFFSSFFSFFFSFFCLKVPTRRRRRRGRRGWKKGGGKNKTKIIFNNATYF